MASTRDWRALLHKALALDIISSWFQSSSSVAPTGGKRLRPQQLSATNSSGPIKSNRQPRSLPPGARPAKQQKPRLTGPTYMITINTFERKPIFSNTNLASICASCLDDRKVFTDAQVLAWVLMPNYAHFLLQSKSTADSSEHISTFKSTSTRLMHQHMKVKKPIWARRNNQCHSLRPDQDLRKLADAIITNPLRKRIIDSLDSYPFWNTHWHKRDKARLPTPDKTKLIRTLIPKS